MQNLPSLSVYPHSSQPNPMGTAGCESCWFNRALKFSKEKNARPRELIVRLTTTSNCAVSA